VAAGRRRHRRGGADWRGRHNQEVGSQGAGGGG